MKPQRFGVVDGGFSANVIPGLVVLLDGVTPEPVFDAGVIVIQSPEGLGCGSLPAVLKAQLLQAGALEPTVENLSNGLGQSESVELIQEPFKETGAIAC